MATKKGKFDWYFKSNLLSRIMIALVAGVVVGIALGYGDPDTVKAFVSNTKVFGDVITSYSIHYTKLYEIDVLKTRAGYFGFELVFGNPEDAAQQDVFGALFQYPIV